MKKTKKETIHITAKAPKKRSPSARVVNQKAPIMQEGPKRMNTRDAKDRAALKDQGLSE
jgi:hypothetical protein